MGGSCLIQKAKACQKEDGWEDGGYICPACRAYLDLLEAVAIAGQAFQANRQVSFLSDPPEAGSFARALRALNEVRA